MELNLLITVTDRIRSKDFISMMRRHGITTILNLTGHGTASQDMLSILGLESSDKILLLAAADKQKTDKIFKDAVQKLYIEVPGNGIMTAIPIRCIGGTKTLNYLTNDKNIDSTPPEISFDKEMIFVIMNSGYSDELMDAARGAGAGGGTVIDAKGTGAKFAQKFFGLTIAEDKQIVIIVTKSKDRTAIISEIMKKCGPGTAPGAVAFSVPATQIAGLRIGEEES